MEGTWVKILFSLLGDLSGTKIVEYRFNNSGANQKDKISDYSAEDSFESFTSIIPMIKKFQPDAVILVLPNSFLNKLPVDLYQSANYLELERHLLDDIKNVKNRNLKEDRNTFELIKEANNGKEPKIVVVPAIGAYQDRNQNYSLTLKSTTESILSEMSYKIWVEILGYVKSFINDENDENLTLYLDLTHGVNYQQFFLNRAVRDIARILSLIGSGLQRKKVSLITSTFSPVQENLAAMHIKVEEIDDVSKIVLTELFELSRSNGEAKILNDSRPLRGKFSNENLLNEFTRYSLLGGVSLSKGFPLHFCYSAIRLDKIGWKEVIRTIFETKVETTKIIYNGDKKVEIEDSIRFTPLFYNTLRTLFTMEILSLIDPEIFKNHLILKSSFDRGGESEIFVEFGMIQKIFNIVWNGKDRKTGVARTISNEISKVLEQIDIARIENVKKKTESEGRKYVILDSEFDEEVIYSLSNNPSDWLRNFYAHAGLSSEVYTFIKKQDILEYSTYKNISKRYKLYLHPLEYAKANNEKSREDLLRSVIVDVLK